MRVSGPAAVSESAINVRAGGECPDNAGDGEALHDARAGDSEPHGRGLIHYGHARDARHAHDYDRVPSHRGGARVRDAR
jgi:hypothetical protein